MFRKMFILIVLLTLVLQGCEEPDRSDRQKYPRPGWTVDKDVTKDRLEKRMHPNAVVLTRPVYFPVCCCIGM